MVQGLCQIFSTCAVHRWSKRKRGAVSHSELPLVAFMETEEEVVVRLAIVTTINTTIARRTVGIVCLPMCGCMTVLKKKIMVAGDTKREFKGR